MLRISLELDPKLFRAVQTSVDRRMQNRYQRSRRCRYVRQYIPHLCNLRRDRLPGLPGTGLEESQRYAHQFSGSLDLRKDFRESHLA